MLTVNLVVIYPYFLERIDVIAAWVLVALLCQSLLRNEDRHPPSASTGRLPMESRQQNYQDNLSPNKWSRVAPI